MAKSTVEEEELVSLMEMMNTMYIVTTSIKTSGPLYHLFQLDGLVWVKLIVS